MHAHSSICGVVGCTSALCVRLMGTSQGLTATTPAQADVVVAHPSLPVLLTCCCCDLQVGVFCDAAEHCMSKRKQQQSAAAAAALLTQAYVTTRSAVRVCPANHWWFTLLPLSQHTSGNAACTPAVKCFCQHSATCSCWAGAQQVCVVGMHVLQDTWHCCIHEQWATIHQ
jgi:hypothetical protein